MSENEHSFGSEPVYAPPLDVIRAIAGSKRKPCPNGCGETLGPRTTSHGCFGPPSPVVVSDETSEQ